MAGTLERFWRIAVLAAVFALGAQMQARGVLASMAKYWGDIVYLSKQHMTTTRSPSVIASTWSWVT